MKSSLLILFGILAICRSTTGDNYDLWKSVDDGTSWERVNSAFTNRINAVQISSRGLLIGTDQGFFLSENDGVTWAQTATAALQRARILCLDSIDKETFIGTRDRGIWLSHDDGHNSTRVGGISSEHISALAHFDNMLLAGSDDGNVFVSANRARSWNLITNGLPENRQIFQLSISRAGQAYAALYSKGLYALRNERWERLGDISSFVIATHESAVFAGQNPGGVWESTDSGATWRPIQGGLPINAPSWVLYANGVDLFYGTTGFSGLYRFSSNSESWEPIDVRNLQGQAVVALAGRGSLMIAATVSQKSGTKLTPIPFFQTLSE